MNPATALLTCAVCGGTRLSLRTAKGSLRLPKGWKVLAERMLCPACLHRQFVLRATVVPVVGPIGMTWPEFRRLLQQVWGDATMCANWLMTECYTRDHRRMPASTMLPPMPRLYLYPAARVRWPRLDPGCVATLHQRVQTAYRAARFEVVWTCARSLPMFRYPIPLPIRRPQWALQRADNRWHCVLRLHSGGGWVTLRLRQGREMQRQMRTLAQIAAGTAHAGEASLYAVSAGASDHRTGVRPYRTRLMLKIAVWQPREEDRDRSGLWHVRTTADALLVAGTTATRVDWTLHGAHIPRLLMAAHRQRRALMEDLKAERRPRRRRTGLLERLRQIRERSRHRLGTVAQEVAAQVVKMAQRQRAATLSYDDGVRSFMRVFPWERLRRAIEDRCQAAGITYVYAGGDGSSGVVRRGDVTSSHERVRQSLRQAQG